MTAPLESGGRLRTAGAVLALAAATAVAAPGGLGIGMAQAAPGLQGTVLNQDRTIGPQRQIVTRMLCPSRAFLPVSWGFRPVGERPEGVVIPAIITSAVPVGQRGRAGFDITLTNPNPGEAAAMKVALTCVRGTGGVRSRPGLSRSAAAAGLPRAHAVAKRRDPTLRTATARKPVTIPSGQRVSRRVPCPSVRNTVVGEVGFESRGSELVGIDYLAGRRPAARVTLQNRTSVDDSGHVHAICLKGERLKLAERRVDAEPQDAAAAVGGRPGVILARVLLEGTAQVGRDGQLVHFGKPLPSPRIKAIPTGSGGLIGAPGGLAEDQFLELRFPFIGTTNGSDPRLQSHRALAFLTRNAAPVSKVFSALKGGRGTRLTIARGSVFTQMPIDPFGP